MKERVAYVDAETSDVSNHAIQSGYSKIQTTFTGLLPDGRVRNDPLRRIK